MTSSLARLRGSVADDDEDVFLFKQQLVDFGCDLMVRGFPRASGRYFQGMIGGGIPGRFKDQSIKVTDSPLACFVFDGTYLIKRLFI